MLSSSAALVAICWHTACVPQQEGGGGDGSDSGLASPAPVNAPWSDSYERTSIGPGYRATNSSWRIEHGKLCSRAGKNHPLWLERRLPENVRIEFDAASASVEGDIKVEIFGDGQSSAEGTSYTNATSYLAIFGGWRNQFHVFARRNEHDSRRLEQRLALGATNPRLRPLQAGQTYQVRIERSDGKTVRVWLDGSALFTFVDPLPLRGRGHEHFGFNNWEAPVCFDNLRIVPLEG